MAFLLALATIRMATLHASHPTLHSPHSTLHASHPPLLSPLRGVGGVQGSGVRLFPSPSGEPEGGYTLSVYNNVESLIFIVQNTLF